MKGKKGEKKVDLCSPQRLVGASSTIRSTASSPLPRIESLTRDSQSKPFLIQMTHETLLSLANSLGLLAMITVVGYHFVAVNSKYIPEQKASR
ncbi:hypothetical protein D9619_000725 [Psilocybe cf. subviscida]|uniref:Dolichyl-diphosphooligosaccharide--protein glycosyltransferase subunit 4 n=1 Tax=Psilocybe cf. subviscida TaxID=2480587 RepID=A0A8H5F262_9AGAR|nr:hypothetical protein D9619_000725 [Psilocybe cf. subviscida]